MLPSPSPANPCTAVPRHCFWRATSPFALRPSRPQHPIPPPRPQPPQSSATLTLTLDHAHNSRSPSPFRSASPSPSTLQGNILRLPQQTSPALFSNELEYLYTGKGLGEAFGSTTPRKTASTSFAKTSFMFGALASTRTFTSPSPIHSQLQIPSTLPQYYLLTASFSFIGPPTSGRSSLCGAPKLPSQLNHPHRVNHSRLPFPPHHLPPRPYTLLWVVFTQVPSFSPIERTI